MPYGMLVGLHALCSPLSCSHMVRVCLQGMSDLLSVVLLVTTDETEAFWIFERLMHRVGGNFDSDQGCCQMQLRGLARLVQLLDPPLHAAIRAAGATEYLFAFRWVMVLLKREFLLSEVRLLILNWLGCLLVDCSRLCGQRQLADEQSMARTYAHIKHTTSTTHQQAECFRSPTG